MDTTPLSSNPAAAREAAIRQLVQRRAGFYRHFMVYLAVVAGCSVVATVLILTGVASSWRRFAWIPFMAGGWGIGVASHAASVFMTTGVFSMDWEERKVQELLAQGNPAQSSTERTQR